MNRYAILGAGHDQRYRTLQFLMIPIYERKDLKPNVCFYVHHDRP